MFLRAAFSNPHHDFPVMVKNQMRNIPRPRSSHSLPVCVRLSARQAGRVASASFAVFRSALYGPACPKGK